MKLDLKKVGSGSNELNELYKKDPESTVTL
jgi:hypothetical protein